MSSKKLQNIKNYESYSTEFGDRRYAVVWRDMESGYYNLDTGFIGMPNDQREECETLEEIEASMRSLVNDLRKWTPHIW